MRRLDCERCPAQWRPLASRLYFTETLPGHHRLIKTNFTPVATHIDTTHVINWSGEAIRFPSWFFIRKLLREFSNKLALSLSQASLPYLPVNKLLRYIVWDLRPSAVSHSRGKSWKINSLQRLARSFNLIEVSKSFRQELPERIKKISGA